jgi:hypothetical protein
MARMTLRSLILATSLLGTPALADAPKPKPPAAVPSDELPLPKDAGAPKEANGGGGGTVVYQIPRGRDVVLAEMRALLEKAHWDVTKDEPAAAPGKAIHLEVTHANKVWRLGFTGDMKRSAIMVTAP